MEPILFKKTLIRALRKPSEAAAYLNAVWDDRDYKFLLRALCDTVKAHGGLLRMANRIGYSRTHLYKALSENGNPEFKTVLSILDQCKIKIIFQEASQ